VPVSDDEVRKIAALGRLALDDAEIPKMGEEMNNILTWMDKLNELDTTDVEPLQYPVEITPRLRPDEPAPSLDRDQLLRNAPATDGEFFLVPTVIKSREK